MNVEATVLGELRALRQRLAGVSGVVLATTDGMLLASDAPGVDPDPIAALTATSIGLSQQFALSVGYGPVREATVRTAGGVIATFPAGDRALLAVLADDRVDPVLLQLEGHAVARRIGPFSDRLGGWAPGPTAPQDDRCSTRPRLTTPMSPVGLPSRRGVLRPPGRP